MTLYLTFKFSFSRAKSRLVFTPVFDGCGIILAGVWWMIVGSGIRLFIVTSSSENLWRSCIISDEIGECIMIFRSKKACLAFSQFKMLGELSFSMFEDAVLAFLPICASIGVIFVFQLGDMRNVLITSATPEANLNGVLFVQFSLLRVAIWVFISFFLPPLLISGHQPMQRGVLIYLICKKNWNFSARNVRDWWHLSLRGYPLFDKYRCIKFIATSALMFETTLAVEKFDHYSVAISIYSSLFSSFGRGLAKSNYNSLLGSTTGSIWNECFFQL